MQNSLIKKVMIIGIMILFLGVTVVPNISGTIENNTNSKDFESQIINDDSQTNNGISKSTEDIDWWTMFHHDKGNTGYSSSNAPHTSNVCWTQEVPYFIDLSSPAIVDDKLYIGTSDTFWKEDFIFKRNIDVFNVLKNHKQSGYFYGLYCYNADTGSLIWEHPTSGMVDSSPAVNNDKVYFVSTDYDFQFATLHCVNAQNGSEIWHDSIDDFSFCSPTISDDSVYVMSYNISIPSGIVYCYYAENGSRKWTFPLAINEYLQMMNPTVAVLDDLVYFVSYNELNYHGTLYCLDAETGIEKWHFNLGYITDFYSISPICANGMVFANGMSSSGQDRIFCLDAETGGTNWVYYLPSTSFTISTPACDFDKLYIVTLDEMYLSTIVYCIDIESGTRIWSRLLGELEVILSSPAVADGKLYFGSWMYGYVYCLDTTDGHTIWLYEIYDIITSSPAIADDRMYIAGSWGTIYAFEDPPNDPPNKPTITGEINGKFGQSYDYTFVATDPDDHNVWYYIDWGDNQTMGWIGPYESGEEIVRSHTWDEQGEYIIRAKAKDVFDAESDWGELEVTMPVNQQSSDSLFLWFLDQFPNAFPILRCILGL